MKVLGAAFRHIQMQFSLLTSILCLKSLGYRARENFGLWIIGAEGVQRMCPPHL